MKINRLSVVLLVMTLTVVLLSCSKSIESKIIGKWHVSSIEESNLFTGEWYDALHNQNIDYEFKADGVVLAYVNGSSAGSSSWSYDADANQLMFDSRPYNIEVLDEHHMVLHYISGAFHLEQRMTLKKQ